MAAGLNGVRTMPEAKLLTLIFKGASSSASVRVKLRTAPLEQS